MAYSTGLTPKDDHHHRHHEHHHHHQDQQSKVQQQQQQKTSTRARQSRHRTMVSFGTIEIREYNRVLDGDYIDVRHALTIGWEFEQRPPISLQAMEGTMECRPLSQDDRKLSSSSSSSSLWELAMSKSTSSLSLPVSSGFALPKCKEERKRILCDFGYSKKELAQAEKDRLRRLKGKPPKNHSKGQMAEVQDDMAVPSSSSFMKLRFLRLPMKPLHRV